MKKFIGSAILLVMLSCGNIETNPVSIESVEETKSVTVVDSCLLRKIVTYVKCFEIDSEEIIVVEFVNKWPETYKKGMIDMTDKRKQYARIVALIVVIAFLATSVIGVTAFLSL